MRNHPLHDSLGPGSPLEKLAQAGGQVLLLGSPLSDVTVLHYAEYLLDIPAKKTVRYRPPVLANGRPEWIDIEELDRGAGIADFGIFDYFTPIVSGYLSTGNGRSAKVGAADSYLLDAAGLSATPWNGCSGTTADRSPESRPARLLALPRRWRILLSIPAARDAARPAYPLLEARR